MSLLAKNSFKVCLGGTLKISSIGAESLPLRSSKDSIIFKLSSVTLKVGFSLLRLLSNLVSSIKSSKKFSTLKGVISSGSTVREICSLVNFSFISSTTFFPKAVLGVGRLSTKLLIVSILTPSKVCSFSGWNTNQTLAPL